MENKQVKETKERKSFKEVCVDNKAKVLVGAGILASATAAYFVGGKIKTNCVNKALKNELHDTLVTGAEITAKVIELDAKRIDMVEKILIEGGVLEQAEATITRKKDRLLGKLNCLVGTQMDPEKEKTIEELRKGIESFEKMLDGCEFIRFFWRDETVEDLLKD